MTEAAGPAAEEGWRRLHPLSPLLRGGLVLLVVGGIVIANLRDRIIEFLLPEEFVDDRAPNESDLIDFVVGRGLIIVALLIVLGAILLVVFFSWLSWRFHTFRISPEAVEERSGIVFRQHRRAPLERIQSVNLQRPLLARILGVTQVDVQTASQGGKVALRYLGHQQAKEVREQILRASARSRAREADEAGHRGGAGEQPEAQGPAAPPLADTAGSGEPILAAEGVRRLSSGGLPASIDRRAREFADLDVDAEARAAGSLVQVPVGRLIGSIALSWELLIPALLVVGSIVAGIAWEPFAFGVTVPMLLVFAGMGYSQFNRGWGFTLSRSADGIRVGAGLTATNTETIPLGRIHAIEARQPLAWRPFGWWRVRITTAGHSVAQGGQNRMQNLVLPVGLEADVLRVFETVLPGGGGDRESVRDELSGVGAGYLGAGRRAGWVLWFGRRRAGLRIAGAGDAAGAGERDPVEIAERVGASDSLGMPGDLVVPAPDGVEAPETRASLRVRRGALTRSLSVMPLVRAQSVQLRRPLVHRMLGLASLQAHTVLGPVRMEMRGLGLDEARDAFDVLAAAIVRVQAAETARRSAERGRGPR